MTTSTDPVVERFEGRRSTGVWGALAGAGVLGVVLAYFLYAYLYLSVSVDEWPPPGVADPPLLRPALLLGVLAASGVLALWAGRPRAGEHAHGSESVALAALAVTGAVVLVLGSKLVADLGLAPDEQAYDAIFTTVHAVQAAATAVGVVIAGLSAFEAHRLGPHPWVSAAAVVSSIWWCTVVSGWIAVFGVVYVWPQLS